MATVLSMLPEQEIPYSRKFSEGKIFGNQAINWISEINF